MLIHVASTSKAKLVGIREAFEVYFDNVEVRGHQVDSQVSRQPLNDEVFLGAENRLKALRKINDDYEFLVSCEAGLIRQYSRLFNAQIVLVQNKEGLVGFGMSPGFEIPKQYEEKALKRSVAKVMDEVFKGQGGIRVLTKGEYTRENLVKSGTIMALTRIFNHNVW